MTAQEFITAITAGGTIEVDTDIDFNDYYFSSTVIIPANTIINGNNHTLTNIQQGTNYYNFTFSGSVTFNNLNIRNLNLPTNALFGGSAGSHNLNECQIAGNCYIIYSSGSYQYQQNIVYNRCSMHINRFHDIQGTLNDCYVIVGNNIITSGNSANLLGTYANNTYFKGNLKITGAMTITTRFMNCCINIDVDNSDYTLTLNSAIIPISIVNSTKAPNARLSSDYLISVTDDEMHDAQALFDKGFNIYVP